MGIEDHPGAALSGFLDKAASDVELEIAADADSLQLCQVGNILVDARPDTTCARILRRGRELGPQGDNAEGIGYAYLLILIFNSGLI